METQSTGTTQLQRFLVGAMTNILEKDKTISKAEAESLLILSQTLEVIAALPAQYAEEQMRQLDTAVIRAIPANSVQPA